MRDLDQEPLGDGEDGEDQDANDEPQIKSKKELYAYYSGRGPSAMVHEFLSDTLLRYQAIVIYSVGAPLEQAYQESLEAMKSVDGQLRFAANRAWTMNCSIAFQCCSKFCDDDLLSRLGFAAPGKDQTMPMAPNLDDEPPAGTLVELEMKVHQLIFNFGATLASETLWTYAHFHWTYPHCLAVYLLPDEKDRAAAAKHIEDIAKAINAAECVNKPSAELKACIQDVSWCSEPLNRLLMQVGLRDGFLNNQHLIGCALKLFAGTGSTKEVLESCFNNCNRQIGFMTTAKLASNPLKWLLCTLNPFIPGGNLHQVLPTEGDWWQALMSPVGQKAIQGGIDHWFHANHTPLPDVEVADVAGAQAGQPGLFSQATILKHLNFKPAGADALQRSVAATAYLTAEVSCGFANVQHCWAGVWASHSYHAFEV